IVVDRLPTLVVIGIEDTGIKDDVLADLGDYGTAGTGVAGPLTVFDDTEPKPVSLRIRRGDFHRLGPSSRPAFLPAASLKADLLPARSASYTSCRSTASKPELILSRAL